MPNMRRSIHPAGPSRRRPIRAALGFVTGLLAVGLVCLALPAEARSTFDSAYGFERTYNAALRLVHLDMGLKVTEKDDKSGYFVFEYKAADTGGKVSSGSIELLRMPDPDAPVRVVVQLPQMPQYHEQVLVDSLVRKLHADYGDPPERPKPPPVPAQPPPDAGGAPDASDDAE
jgi:hypothetical protein